MSRRTILVSAALFVVTAVGTAAADQHHGKDAEPAKPAVPPAAAPAKAPATAPAPEPPPTLQSALERIDKRVREVLANRAPSSPPTHAIKSARRPTGRVELRWRIDLTWPVELEAQAPAPAEDRIRLNWQ